MTDPFRPPTSVWGPPDPATRIGADPAAARAAGDTAVLPVVPARRGPARGAVFALAAFVVGVLLSVGVGVLLRDGGREAGTALVRPAATAPAPTAPAAPDAGSSAAAPDDASGDRPAASAPPAGSAPTVPSAPADGATEPGATEDGAEPAELGTGVVIIDTLMGYEGGEGAGTGMVITADGDVLTNHHVIEGATRIVVTIAATGERYEAKVVGSDASRDVAVIRLQGASGLATVPLGDSGAVRVGDEVVAAGNAGGRGVITTSPGQVTGLGETITATDSSGGDAETLFNLIQVSSALVPGQSGGPLYDADLRVIGMNAAGSAGNLRFRGRDGTGEGFVIPIADALGIATEIQAGRASDTITIGTRPILGIIVVPDATVDGTVAGIVVEGLATDGPAARAGIRPGDVIVTIDGAPIRNGDDLAAAIGARRAGDRVAVGIERNGRSATVELELASGPAE